MSGRRPLEILSVVSRWAVLAFRVIVISVVAVMPHVFAPVTVSAFDCAAPFTDPLFALPDRIVSGTTLPGDAGPVTCPAGINFSTSLDLVKATDVALCNNPRLRATWAAIKLQSAEVGQARAAYLPTLSGNVNFMKTRYEYPGSGAQTTTENGITINATLSWRIFDFGGRTANRKSANSLLIAALALHDAELQKKLAEVIQAYFDAVTAQAFLHSKEQHESIAENTLQTARRRETRGAAARSDTLQAATALTKATLEKYRAQGDYRKAVAALVSVLGIPVQSQVILPDDLNVSSAPAYKSLDEWLNIASVRHPSILAGRAELESAMKKIATTRSEGLPTVDVSANYYQNGYPGQGISRTESRVSTVALSISFPIFEGFARTYKIRGAEALAEQKKAELFETEQATLMEVVKAYTDAETSLRNLGVSERLLNIAREALHVAQRKYEKGAADILEILNTQAALADARQERIRCLAEWRSAGLRLMAGVGVLGSEALKW